MQSYRVLSWGLMAIGGLLIALSFAAGLGTRVESARWSAPAAALSPTPTPEMTPLTPSEPAPAAALITPPPYPLPVPALPPASGNPPVRLAIPTIGLEAPVVPVTPTLKQVGEQTVQVWPVPDIKAAGWQVGSAYPGMGSNVVLNGHNTTHGEVFRDLYRLQVGALIYVTDAAGTLHSYRVEEMQVVPERDVALNVRLENARFILPSADERLTLITCHPYGSTRYRLIVIARPYTPTCTGTCS